MPAPSPESGSAPDAPRCSRLRSAVNALATMSWLGSPVRVATKATPHASCSWRPSYKPSLGKGGRPYIKGLPSSYGQLLAAGQHWPKPGVPRLPHGDHLMDFRSTVRTRFTL